MQVKTRYSMGKVEVTIADAEYVSLGAMGMIERGLQHMAEEAMTGDDGVLDLGFVQEAADFTGVSLDLSAGATGDGTEKAGL